MANPQSTFNPEPEHVSDAQLGNLSPDEVRNNGSPSSSPEIVEFAEQMLKNGQEYADAMARQTPEQAAQSEPQSLDAIRQDQQRMGQEREESQSLDALQQSAGNDNREPDRSEPERDGREEMFASHSQSQERSEEQETQRDTEQQPDREETQERDSDGREELFGRAETNEPEQAPEQEQDRQQEMEMDR